MLFQRVFVRVTCTCQVTKRAFQIVFQRHACHMVRTKASMCRTVSINKLARACSHHAGPWGVAQGHVALVPTQNHLVQSRAHRCTLIINVASLIRRLHTQVDQPNSSPSDRSRKTLERAFTPSHNTGWYFVVDSVGPARLTTARRGRLRPTDHDPRRIVRFCHARPAGRIQVIRHDVV